MIKTLVLGYLRELCGQIEVDDPDCLAKEVARLLGVAIVAVQVSGDPRPVRVAERVLKKPGVGAALR